MIEAFKNYMESVGRLSDRATCRLEQPSSSVENGVNVFVQAGTFDGCQSIIQNVMDDCTSATFTIPVKSADGLYLAVGHYIKSTEDLPEF